MTLLAILAFMTTCFTIATYVFKKPVLAFAGAGGWVIFGVYSYTMSVAAWDIYYGIFFLAMGMVIVCVLEPILMRQKKDELSDEIYDNADKYSDRQGKFREKLDKFKTLSSSDIKRRRAAKRLKKFNRTGEE